MTKIYVSKYALRTGVTEHEAEIDDGANCATYVLNGYKITVHGNDFHENKIDALKKAEEMRVRKLKLLDTQIKKLSSIKFYF